jgi:hypothetical protein
VAIHLCHRHSGASLREIGEKFGITESAVSLWPALFPVATMFCKQPTEWPILFGVAIQEALDAGKEALPPDIAFKIVMESAIPMSKVDLAAV